MFQGWIGDNMGVGFNADYWRPLMVNPAPGRSITGDSSRILIRLFHILRQNLEF